MIVRVADNAGFCKGVQRAFDLALELSEKYDRVYTLGELVHNENVTEFLKSKRIYCIKDEDFGTLKSGDVALIRAHGISRYTEAELKARGVILFDATCPVVKKNQSIAEHQSAESDEIIIIGDKDHDEVKGLVSYSGKNVRVLPDTADIEISSGHVSILFQTTILKEKFEKIKSNIANLPNFDQKSVGIFDTCCYNTTIRQKEARVLASKSDAVIVVGSKNSANTRRLFEVSAEVNKNTFFVQSAADLKSIKYSKQRKVISVLAGASTPPWLIREVTQLMSEETIKAVEETKEATLQEQTEPTTMEELMAMEKNAGFVKYEVGKTTNCTVIKADETGIIVSIGGKKDGFIDKEDASYDGNYDPANYKKGASFAVKVKSVDKDYVKLSRKEIEAREIENAEAEKAIANGEFDIVISEVVKGGLRARLGKYKIFVPSRQIRIGFVKDLEQYKGKKMHVAIIPSDEGEEATEESEGKSKKNPKSIVASRRVILEREKKATEDAFWNNIHVDDIVRGKVKRYASFGAFVEVCGSDGKPHDCLAPISELSWEKIKDPHEVLEMGEEYDFVVLKADRENNRVALSYKKFLPKPEKAEPYELAAEKYPVGTIITGKVHSIQPYGAFVQIDRGIDGLVHVSQIANSFTKDANEVLKVGDEVTAKIIGFEQNRITLSMKELLPKETATSEFEATEEEKMAKKANRSKKFEKVADGEAAPKKERRPKKAAEDETTEFISGTATASLGDLLRGLKEDLEKEEN